MKQKFSHFLDKLELDVPLKESLLEAYSFIFEDVGSVGSSMGYYGSPNVADTPSPIGHSTIHTNPEMKRLSSKLMKNKFRKFMTKIHAPEALIESVMESIELLESYQTIGDRPMADNIFNMASGESEFGVAAGQTINGIDEKEPEPREPSVSLPTITVAPKEDIKKLIAGANSAIPQPNLNNPYAPTITYRDFFTKAAY